MLIDGFHEKCGRTTLTNTSKHAITELKEKKLSKIRIVKSKTTASG